MSQMNERDEWQAVVSEMKAAHTEMENSSGPEDMPQELMEQFVRTMRAVSAYPVSTIHMLAEKMDLLVNQYGIEDFGGGDEAEHVYADILRLVGRPPEEPIEEPTEPEKLWDLAVEAIAQASETFDQIYAQYAKLEAIRAAEYGPQPRPEGVRTQEELLWCTASGLYELAQQSDAAGAVLSEKEWDLLLTPAPHYPALLRKLEWALDQDTEPSGPAYEAVLADVRRLLGGASQ